MRSGERWIARSTDRVRSTSSSSEPGWRCCRSFCFRSLLRYSLEPDVDRLPLYPDHLGGGGLGHAGLLDQEQRASA
jgi:hypothetical protein